MPWMKVLMTVMWRLHDPRLLVRLAVCLRSRARSLVLRLPGDMGATLPTEMELMMLMMMMIMRRRRRRRILTMQAQVQMGWTTSRGPDVL